ncbi:TonB family protein [Novosphingobium sp. PhB165]|uniref:TonB family protein n=1 Tax=Novosphingobium sp. PhB165 TaxID=2485105 RepID=UPI0014050BEE|nr:TonB family protein [Novosphingobium sp. PhB165]
MRRPLNDLAWGDRVTPPSAPTPVTLQFDIDSAGRAVSIKDKHAFGDFGPALAASKFPATARQGCSITYMASAQPVASASVADLVSYMISPIVGALPPEGWARIRLEGTCGQLPRPQPLLRAFPDFRHIAGTPGVKDWAAIAYDTDAEGKPIHVRLFQSNGNAALEDAAVKAISDSRFSGGARTGCTYPYWRMPKQLPAPAMPDKSAFPASGTACPADRKWATPPVKRYPGAYSRRRIEGWAIVRYDIAPWGVVGNVTVLAAQPSEQFGDEAARSLETAKFEPSPQGASGCVERMKFVMPADGSADDLADFSVD